MPAFFGNRLNKTTYTAQQVRTWYRAYHAQAKKNPSKLSQAFGVPTKTIIRRIKSMEKDEECVKYRADVANEMVRLFNLG